MLSSTSSFLCPEIQGVRQAHWACERCVTDKMICKKHKCRVVRAGSLHSCTYDSSERFYCPLGHWVTGSSIVSHWASCPKKTDGLIKFPRQICRKNELSYGDFKTMVSRAQRSSNLYIIPDRCVLFSLHVDFQGSPPSALIAEIESPTYVGLIGVQWTDASMIKYTQWALMYPQLKKEIVSRSRYPLRPVMEFSENMRPASCRMLRVCELCSAEYTGTGRATGKILGVDANILVSALNNKCARNRYPIFIKNCRPFDTVFYTRLHTVKVFPISFPKGPESPGVVLPFDAKYVKIGDEKSGVKCQWCGSCYYGSCFKESFSRFLSACVPDANVQLLS